MKRLLAISCLFLSDTCIGCEQPLTGNKYVRGEDKLLPQQAFPYDYYVLRQGSHLLCIDTDCIEDEQLDCPVPDPKKKTPEKDSHVFTFEERD
jgi:hypothetical protein